MIAQIVSVFLLVGSGLASQSLVSVDPNTLSCDPEGQEFLLLPHYSDCSKFYMCANGAEVEFSCSEGLYFDFPLQVCNYPSDTHCVLRGQDDEDIEGSGSGDGLEEIAALSHLNGFLDSSRMLPKEPAFVVNSVLDCRSADAASRQAAYVGDCQRYWRCINGVPQTAYCSDGLFFNEATQQCDFEGNVRCAIQVDDELKGEFIVY